MPDDKSGTLRGPRPSPREGCAVARNACGGERTAAEGTLNYGLSPNAFRVGRNALPGGELEGSVGERWHRRTASG